LAIYLLLKSNLKKKSHKESRKGGPNKRQRTRYGLMRKGSGCKYPQYLKQALRSSAKIHVKAMKRKSDVKRR
tara:strand:- start:125 stop:340 length:216 start_codon:yes stop_codon:yes gene_type:complete